MTSSVRINGPLQQVSCLLVAMLFLGTVNRETDAQTVELTVMSQGGGSIETHQWAQTLDRAGFDRVRIQPTNQDRVVIEAVRSGRAIRVTGVLDASHRLRLPGGSFARNDIAGLARWLEELKAPDQGQAPGFGLSPDELADLSRTLGSQTVGPTQGLQVTTVLTELADQLNLPLQVSGTARTELEAADPIFDEMEGLAAGTAMAAILRPWGLAVVPEKSGGTVALQVVPFDQVEEFWPVGWPPQTAVTKLVRKLYEREQIQINDVSLREAMDALQPLIGLPLLWDHNGMARQSIDPETVRVSFPSATTTFKRVLARVLSQAKLKSEVRVDEAGQPFLWIAPKRG